MAQVPVEYPFIAPSEEREYRLFPDDLENDPRVLFRGTTEAELASVLQSGFETRGPLPSVSFAEKSSLALRYAYESGRARGELGVVIVTQFRAADVPFASFENGIVHVYRFDEQPAIIGYCVIPAGYVFW